MAMRMRHLGLTALILSSLTFLGLSAAEAADHRDGHWMVQVALVSTPDTFRVAEAYVVECPSADWKKESGRRRRCSNSSRRTFWSYSNRWPGFYYANDAPKAGQILVFDEKTTYGLHQFTKKFSRSSYFAPATEGCELFADDNRGHFF